MTAPVVKVVPLLSVHNGAAAVDFYRAAFGVEERFRVDDADGKVVATLGIGELEFWVADESPEHANFSPPTLGGSTARMILACEDPDALFGRALAAGAKEVWPPVDQHGWRIGRVEDPFGHHWEIARPPAPCVQDAGVR